MQLFVHLQRVVRFLCLIPRCRQAIRIDVTKKSLTPYTESEKPCKIVSFEVRGGTPCEFEPSVFAKAYSPVLGWIHDHINGRGGIQGS